MMGMIGFATGLTGFFLHQCIDVIADAKWSIAKSFISQNKSQYATAWITGVLYRRVMLQRLNFK